jgi:hypothetical protein
MLFVKQDLGNRTEARRWRVRSDEVTPSTDEPAAISVPFRTGLRQVRGRAPLWRGLAAAAVVSLGGCSNGNGLPAAYRGTKILNQLAAERVFQTFPSNTHATAPLRKVAAHYVNSGFESGGPNGPAVTLTFVSTTAAQTVFAFYVTQAQASGWSPNGNRNVLGYPEVWTKPYPAGLTASLGLIDLNVEHPEAGPPSTYVLTASA